MFRIYVQNYSVGKITKNGFEVTFTKVNAFVTGTDGDVKLIADKIGELYFARENISNASNSGSALAAHASSDETFEVWHRRPGHLNVRDIIGAINKGSVLGLEKLKPAKLEKDSITCEVCLQGKMVRTPFPKRSYRVSNLLALVHSDVCGPMRAGSMNKK